MEIIWKNAISSNFPNLVIDLEVSNTSEVRKITNGLIFKPRLKDGYLSIKRNKKNIFIHHLVAETFISKRPIGLVIDHIDGNKVNNHVSNLRYITNIANVIKGNSNDKQIPQHIKNVDKIKLLDNKLINIEEKIDRLLEHFKLL